MTLYRHTKSGREVESSSTLGYPWVAADAPYDPKENEFAARTADAILADVGDDPELAAAALAAEQEREKPRVVLSRNLQAIIDAAE